MLDVTGDHEPWGDIETVSVKVTKRRLEWLHIGRETGTAFPHRYTCTKESLVV